MSRRVGVVGIVALSGVVVLAACGSSKSPSAAQTPPTSAGPTTSALIATTTTATSVNFDSCSVVTQAEAGSALGQPVAAGVLGTATVEGGLACVFYGPSTPTPRNPNVAQRDSVRVVVVNGADASTWYDDYKSKAPSPQPITGYGDQAFYDGFASLSILKGGTYVRIAVNPTAAPPSLADEEQLAMAILPSL